MYFIHCTVMKRSISLCVFVVDSPIATLSAPVLDETQTGVLSCTVSSKPSSTITLYNMVNNKVVGTVTNNHIAQYGINATARENAGTYRCTAHNGLGSDSNDMDVVVRCENNLFFFL